jgi:RNA polymerase sigma factor (sigma-70 family)
MLMESHERDGIAETHPDPRRRFLGSRHGAPPGGLHRLRPDVEIVLMSRDNFLLMTSLLFEVFSGTLDLRGCSFLINDNYVSLRIDSSGVPPILRGASRRRGPAASSPRRPAPPACRAWTAATDGDTISVDVGSMRMPSTRIMPDRTTAVVQRCLDALAGDSPLDPLIRDLLDRAVGRLEMLCANMLYRSYPRLTRPPLALETEEVVGAVVERLLKAMRAVRPRTVREFFGLANQHIRWELNDLARRLDERPADVELREGLVPAPAGSDSVLTPDARRILKAIDGLPEEEREAFNLLRIHGLTQTEAAEVLGVSIKTVQRRLNRGLVILADQLDDLKPD